MTQDEFIAQLGRDDLRDPLTRWLHEQVGPALDALLAKPSRAVSVDRLRARIAAEHAAVTQKRAKPLSPAAG